MPQNNEHPKFFFIIGRPRSGTTLLRTVMDAHPQLKVPLESAFILNLYSQFHNKKWDKKTKLQFIETLKPQRKASAWQLDWDDVTKTFLETDIQSYQQAVLIPYQKFYSIFPKEKIIYYGDKTPSYSFQGFFIKKLMQIFPEAKFIHLIRDYRANANSVKKFDFSAPEVSLITMRWKNSLKQITKIKEKYPRKWHTLMYENFVDNPLDELKKIESFLGIDHHPEALEYYKYEKEAFESFSKVGDYKKFHANLFSPISNTYKDSWKEKLSEKEIKVCDTAVGKWGEAVGYKPIYPFSFWIWFKILPAKFYNSFWYVLNIFFFWFPYRFVKKIRGDRNYLAILYRKLFKH